MSKDLNYEGHHRILVEYLLAKVEIRDWHAVADAAMDLRELEARRRAIDDYRSLSRIVPAQEGE